MAAHKGKTPRCPAERGTARDGEEAPIEAAAAAVRGTREPEGVDGVLDDSKLRAGQGVGVLEENMYVLIEDEYVLIEDEYVLIEDVFVLIEDVRILI